ncbi:FAD-binding oxidoreductase [Solwaraspora sp. WMMA2059]|uniref:FAD-binding oxidoreductase n=1 Tax=Solwaraspora sp. WMMA2059 TaxID=3015160 RepID=UPI00248BBA4F|nr:FAD-binding oxidoreductase [Solwaraspora sp. WMMA2059]WBB96651.1 FAD-binding oxidoreductase [Solwaraspora sp. WMMA2059]
MIQDVAARLAEICGAAHVRDAGPDDEVAAAAPRWVAAPGTASATAEVLRLCADRDLTLIPRGSGSKLDWWTPPSYVDIVLDTSRLAGVWHRPPGSRTVRVGAGTPLHTAQQAVGRAGWRMPLDPPSASATVGGIVATDETGPLSHRHGPPCRHVTGVDYVDAAGRLVRAASETDDAGDEPPQLLCGSQGALAVLVAATVRLQPVPADRRWVRRTVHTPLEVRDLVGELTVDGLHPVAVELDLPAHAARTVRPSQVPPGGQLAVLFEGEPGLNRQRAGRAAALLGGDAVDTARPPVWWRRYPFTASDIALRLDVPAAHLHAAIYAVRDAVGAPIGVRGSVGTGLVHAVLPGSTTPERVAETLATVRSVLLARSGSCVVLTAPAEVRQAVDIWGHRPGLPRLLELKQRFDPQHRLAPGRFTGGS